MVYLVLPIGLTKISKFWFYCTTSMYRVDLCSCKKHKRSQILAAFTLKCLSGCSTIISKCLSLFLGNSTWCKCKIPGIFVKVIKVEVQLLKYNFGRIILITLLFHAIHESSRNRLDRNLVCELHLSSGTYVQSFGSIALRWFSEMAAWRPYLNSDRAEVW
jgi:hypothetical protein